MTPSDSFGVEGCRSYAPAYPWRHRRVVERTQAYSGDDPMVWSSDEWRSSLMGGYARDYDSRYDLRFRHKSGPVVVKRIERMVILDEGRDEHMVVKPHARGPKIVTIDGAEPVEHANFAAHRCRGALILMWKAGVPVSKCVEHGPRDRLRQTPG